MSSVERDECVVLPPFRGMVSSSFVGRTFDNLYWMTTNEAATYLRKSTNALRTAVCRGHVTAKKFRRRLYFKRSDLDRLIETSTTIGG